MKCKIPAVIFAGGKSSRMGRDKALLPFADYNSLAQYQYVRLQGLFEKVYISTKEDKFDFRAELIYDRYDVSSPLAGILSIFETLDADEIFILSVDAPFVDENVIEKLFEENKEGTDAVIAQSPDGLQPLCGVYKRSLLPLAKTHFQENRHRLTQLLKEAKSKFVAFKDNDPFTNLNHPHEYEKALKEI
ncbi:molybdopterin-guanine dinucleotide biosynthesis protein MobA [Sulfurovum lithotrophicum]|uniref:Probable molybdenum cofactor guanylyltransferase n=1 Tax=Sulfurovum lithotrophicum TaxID=206403 RepID=A0A7U4RPQ1_9BACT|nr:molybdenum cofactor guanylyltransferase MobA [Sulfurovum lithotrophicum]AKF23985.1 molybdopterin-guanine dinucleotide biosynthesis protein MobA [Sulfurovum lithotrophicum]